MAVHGVKGCPVEPTNRSASRVCFDLCQPGLGVLYIFTIQESFEQFLFPLEIQVDGPAARARFLCNIAHGGLVISQSDENGCSCIENLLLSFVIAAHSRTPSTIFAHVAHNLKFCAL